MQLAGKVTSSNSARVKTKQDLTIIIAKEEKILTYILRNTFMDVLFRIKKRTLLAIRH